METERRKKKKKVCHRRPKFTNCSLSRTFVNLRKCVSCDGTYTQTNTHTDGHGNSRKSTSIVLCYMLLWWWNLWSKSISTLARQPYYSHVTSLCGEPLQNMLIFLTHFTLYTLPKFFFSILETIIQFVSSFFFNIWLFVYYIFTYYHVCLTNMDFFLDFLVLKFIFTKIGLN